MVVDRIDIRFCVSTMIDVIMNVIRNVNVKKV